MELYQHQKRGVEFLCSAKQTINKKNILGGFLIDEMGLGKTCQAIVSASRLQSQVYNNKVLVACPAFLKFNWLAEIDSLTKAGLASRNIEWHVISYTSFAKAHLPCAVYILDESHSIKNPKTKVTKGVLAAIKAHNPVVMLLSGTPAPKDMADYYCQLLALDAVPYRRNSTIPWSYYGWCNVFMKRVVSRYGVRHEGVIESKLPIFHEILNSVAIHRQKAATLDLPEKIHRVIPIRCKIRKDENYALVFSAIEEAADFDDFVGKFKHIDNAEMHVATTAKQIGLAKVDSVAKYAQSLVEDGVSPLLVWAHHIEVLETLSQELNAPVITGATSMSDRHKLVEKFQRGEIPVMVCSMGAAGTGLTLTAAKHAVFAELCFRPTIIRQAEDRIHRIGQKESVVIDHVIAESSFEKRLIALIQQKIKMQEQTLGGVNE